MKKLLNRVRKCNSLLCVGLDSETSKLPKKFLKTKHPQYEFNKWIIDETNKFVCAYKPNVAFYESRGDRGIRELKMTMEYLKRQHNNIFTICDAKRGDVGNTSQNYAEAIFDWLGFDAVTLNPYLGAEALEPFLNRKDKVSIILCRTSNPGAGEFQDLRTSRGKVWERIAWNVVTSWDKDGNCMLVIGATYPKELKRARAIAKNMWFLVPGIGAQGGSIKEAMKAGATKEGGLIINSARNIIFEKTPGDAARRLKEEINSFYPLPGS
jgi:orotidine-5'-phosphate decarboxylase